MAPPPEALEPARLVSDGAELEPLEEEAIGGRRSPLRRCIVTGAVADREGMIRFAVAPDGSVVPDLEGTLPGRGLWVTADRDILATAVSKNRFAKSARRKTKADPGLVALVEKLLKRRCLDMIGLGRRGGVAIAGFEKVRESLRNGKAGALLAASDGSEDGRGKLRGLAGDAPIVDLFDAAELGHAFGRDHVVHAMLAPGRMAARFLLECRRYAALRRGIPSDGNCGPASAGRATDLTTS
ncbi:50S ribosomal protein L7 [Skermanella stibiiresistens SB22]|uniref:50S ribosomal protein L7 n=1 Tax=Skermanella stibiiresistens SB22 TaxID=1385369 RepID=W9H8K9_9PROT|nr:50S ribosomal protein L7 [Skermanella stibiiresistens SB22]